MTTYEFTLVRDSHFIVGLERADGSETAVLKIATPVSTEGGHLSYTTVIPFFRLEGAVEHLSQADRRPS